MTDPEIAEMDDWLLAWYYAQWIEELDEETRKLKDFGTFVGGFSNPELANKIRDAENNTREVSDEDFEKAFEYVTEYNNSELNQQTNRRRRD